MSDEVVHEPVNPGSEAEPAEGKTNQPETGDPSVPTELLDLHVQLEEAGVTPDEFKEVYGAEASNESGVGGTETSPSDGQAT